MSQDKQPSPTEIKQAISGMRSADKRSDIAYNNALKDNKETNKQLSEMAQDNDKLMARIHQIGNRLADPHERSQKISERKEARLQKRIQRQYEKTQELIHFWTKKFLQHIDINNIDDNTRKEDETLNKIEMKLIKYGVDTDDLFKNRKENKVCIDPNNINKETMKQIAQNKDIESESDEEEQLRNLDNMEYVEVTHTTEEEQEDKGRIKIINVNDKDINFKPSKHRYPGLSDVKPISSLSTYQPITAKQMENKMEIQDIEQDQSKRYRNLEKKVSDDNNALYPSINGPKLKTNFKKYVPMDRSNIKVKKDEDDDDLLDELDDIDGIKGIGDDLKDTMNIDNNNNEIRNDDEDLLDELDDVEVPLTMYKNSAKPKQNQNNINQQTQIYNHMPQNQNNNYNNQRQPMVSNTIHYGSPQMYQRPNPQQQMYNQPFPQHNMMQYGAQQRNQIPQHQMRNAPIQKQNQTLPQQMYQNNNNRNMYYNPQQNVVNPNQMGVNNYNYGNIHRAKSVDSIDSQNSDKKAKGYPNVKKKNAGGYPNIYAMKKPDYSKPLPQSTKQSKQINDDNDEDLCSVDQEIDEGEFSV